MVWAKDHKCSVSEESLANVCQTLKFWSTPVELRDQTVCAEPKMSSTHQRSSQLNCTGVSGSRLRGDSGAVLVEAAMVTPLFMVLIFGVVEFGGAFRDYLTVSNAVSQGARMTAIQANGATADWTIVQAIKKATSAMPQSQINRIVIFKATGASSVVPAICKTSVTGYATVGSECNVFLPSDIALATTPSTWLCPIDATHPASQGSNPIAFWCSTARKVNLSVATGGPPSYVGIYVEATHPWITGLFGNSLTLSDTSITQLEPQKA